MNLLETIKLLADETRFNIVELLLTNDFCVGALARKIGISEAAISQHIQILRKGGLVKGEKRGYWTHYAVNTDALNQIAKQLNELANLSTTRQPTCSRLSSQPLNIVGENTTCNCGCKHSKILLNSAKKRIKKQTTACRE
jgi:ArsR family transcriptional regulator, arsenate/arsenite/antimonite-responsive transcriptional repressor